jgi:membrane fusion protein, hemolysin D
MRSSNLAILPVPVARVVRRDEREFLPAALEVIETPASPVGRAIGGLIILFFLLALAWAVIGRVEIVATAPGAIVPSGRTKVIQPLEIGIVRAINAHDGQRVRAGEVLVELDPTASAAERDRLKSELVMARLDIARLTAILSDAPDPAGQLVAPPGATPAQISLARQLIVSQVAGYRAKLAELDRQQAEHRANRAAVAATVDKLSALLPVLRQRLEMRETLYNRKLGSKLNYLAEQEPVIESERELVVQNDRLAEAEAALLAIAEQRHQAEAEFRRSHLAELVEEEEKAEDLGQDLVKAEQRLQLQTLTAPVDGVVQQLAIHTLGGVVTPAEALMAVVPADSPLEIEATVSNQDIGFVHAGQKAAIKIDTFNFTRYGLRHGEVLSVSLDAVGADAAAETGTAPGGMAAAQPRSTGGRLAYTARISLDRTTMQTEGGLVDLRPGMAVTVEIDTGTRRVIDYLLSPLLRYSQESLRER